jgi:5,10-methenyltetrahydrofolate synthetase
MHELGVDGPALSDEQQWRDVMRWRKAERQRLIQERMAMELALRRDHTRRIMAHLDAAIGDVAGLVVSLYWPIRAEPDLREWMDALPSRNAVGALPVVVAKGQPMLFRAWKRGERLVPGVWNIPTPADGPEVVPDIVIAPIVGFDAACYRLGYGGGYFDRTLAAMRTPRRAIGVGYDRFRLRTIYPQAHDIPMDAIVTEAGAMRPA